VGSLYLLDLPTVLRAAGLTVYEVDGWQTRARGSGGYEPGRPNHVMTHHTASPASADGWDDVNYCTFHDDDAPLCNLYINREGKWWVCAAGATNTNGSGHDPCGFTPDDSMNSHAIGIEAGNNGVGETWPNVQLDSYLKACRALCDAYGIPDSRIHAHHEWAPTRKTDPAGPPRYQHGGGPSPISWTMSEFRADVDSLAPGPEPEPTPEPSHDLGAIHDEGDPMFIAQKDDVFWIGNGLGRRKLADDEEIDFLIEKFQKAGTPLRDLQNGRAVSTRDQVSGARQMNQLGVDVAK
jgi:hypothetical protein